MEVNFATPIWEEICKYAVKKRWQRDQFINSPHLLTRLIYFALGMTDRISQSLKPQFLMEEVELMHNIDKQRGREKEREKSKKRS